MALRSPPPPPCLGQDFELFQILIEAFLAVSISFVHRLHIPGGERVACGTESNKFQHLSRGVARTDLGLGKSGGRGCVASPLICVGVSYGVGHICMCVMQP